MLIIKQYINGVPKEDLKLKYKSIVERASEQSSTTEKNADECEREVDDYKKAVYMTKHLGEEFIGTISGVQEFGIFVELENGIEGLVKLDWLPSDEYVYDDMSLTLHGSRHHYTIGDSVKVIVASANTHLRQIDFELSGVEKAGNNFVRKKENKEKNKKYNKNYKKTIKNNKKSRKNAKNSRKKR